MIAWPILYLLRLLLLIGPAKISLTQATAIMRAECARRGYDDIEPVRVTTQGLHEYIVRTNADKRGGSVWAKIDIHSGEIKHIAVTQR